MIDDKLYDYMTEMLRQTPMAMQRYIYDEINWDSRLVGIVGPRGVGKSTLLLQRIRRSSAGSHLYVSADHFYFSHHSLIDLVDDFVKENGTHIYIDEIHKYPNWSRELKQIYDTHPSLRVVFTGSSVLDILHGEADLSRRALIYTMQGLSFREYLQLFHSIDAEVFTLDDILAHRAVIGDVEHPLPLFRDYLRRGYYPFALDDNFDMRMQQVVAQTIEVDIPQYANMKAATARKLKAMLSIIASLAPFKPNADSLAAEIGVSKNSIPDYLVYMEKAGMIAMLRDNTSGLRALGKVEKVYVDNPSLMNAIAPNANVGNLRETFFLNQMRVRHRVSASRESDFTVNGYTFEVGGRSKGAKQIEGISNGRIVRDDIETGHGIVLPLWAFGLTY